MTLRRTDFVGRSHVEPSMRTRIRVQSAPRVDTINPWVPILLARFTRGGIGVIDRHVTLAEFTEARDPEGEGGLPSKLAEMIFRPSLPPRNGAPLLETIRVGADVGATLQAPDAASVTLDDSGAAAALVLTSRDYGVHTNSLRAQVEAASGVLGGVRLTVRYKESPAWLKSGDNLGPLLRVRYDGNGSAAAMTVTVTDGAATAISTVLTAASDGSQNLSIDLTQSDFNTIKKVVDYINAQPGYSCLVAPTDVDLTLCPSSALDAVAAVDIDLAAPNFATFSGALGAIIEWVNRELVVLGPSGGVSAARSGAAVNPPGVTAGYESFAGGAQVATTGLTSWQAALDLIETEERDRGILVVDSDDDAVRALVFGWIVDQFNNNGRRFRACFGLPAGTSAEDGRTEAAESNYPGVALFRERALSQAAEPVVMTPMEVAAAVAGMTAGMVPFTDIQSLVLTNAVLRASGIHPDDKQTKTVRDASQDAGLNALREERGRVRFGLVVSTAGASRNTAWRRWSESIVLDWLAISLEDALRDEGLQVAWGTDDYVTRVQSAALAVFRTFTTAGILSSGIDPETGEAVPAYTPPQVDVLDGVTSVSASVAFAGESDHVRNDILVQRVALSA